MALVTFRISMRTVVVLLLLTGCAHSQNGQYTACISQAETVMDYGSRTPDIAVYNRGVAEYNACPGVSPLPTAGP